MKNQVRLPLLILLLSAATAAGVEHRVEVLKEAAPADGISKEIADQLSKTGVKVIRGTSRTVCDIWLRKEWETKKDFKATNEVLFPFKSGDLIGVLRFTRRGKDFRDQTVSKGIYTLRYGQQPVDGNHEGTSPTRDFLLLVSTEQDKSLKTMPAKQLLEWSAEAADLGHPAFLSLQKVKKRPSTLPSIRHDENRDWWIVALEGKEKSGEKNRPLVLELVVAGVAPE